MITIGSLLLVVLGSLSSIVPAPAHTRTLTFEQRVEAQIAIERVYYSHQIGARRPFEQAAPREVIESKVRAYLERSAAWEKAGHGPVTGEALRTEWVRIERRSRLPGRLEEIYDALGRDPILIEECFVRPVLVGRAAAPAAGDVMDEPVASSCLSETWSDMSIVGAPAARFYHTVIWTGTLMVVWGGWDDLSNYVNSGGRYDPLTDSWTSTSLTGAPEARVLHTAVWTGDEMVIWGGQVGYALNTGGRYDPITDTWRATSTVGAPEGRFSLGRYGHSALWTGSRMIVWGGNDETRNFGDGGSYDPVTDTWQPLSTVDAPLPRRYHHAFWTGTRMIVWGGDSTNPLSGGIYDPGMDTWTPMSTVDAPEPRQLESAVWTGREMVVWGGQRSDSTPLETGARYDPLADLWTPTSLAGAPSPRYHHVAVWDGSRMLVWSGEPTALDTGGRYDPDTDTWEPMTTEGAPTGRAAATAVWTGRAMIVWGGGSGITHHLLASGGLYSESDPDADGDGYTTCDGDCNDFDPSVSPAAIDLPGNRLDENCDGVLACDPDAAWRSHGRFVSCVARACDALVARGAVGVGQCMSLVSKAARLQPSTGP